MKIKISILIVLSLIIILLYSFQEKQKKKLRQYQEAFEFEEKITSRMEERMLRLLYKTLEAQNLLTSQETKLIDSLHKQQNMRDFRSQLSKNRDSPFLSGFYSSLDCVYDSLLLDRSKIELWRFLQNQYEKKQEQVFSKKMLLRQIPSNYKDSVSFVLTPVNTIDKFPQSSLSYGNQRIKISSFPILFSPEMKKIKFTLTNPLLKRPNIYTYEF